MLLNHIGSLFSMLFSVASNIDQLVIAEFFDVEILRTCQIKLPRQDVSLSI